MEKIIDEVREITAQVVAKKQDAAKLNYPKVVDKIKAQASFGFSECKFCENGIAHKAAQTTLGKLLGADMYKDNSGFNWHLYNKK